MSLHFTICTVKKIDGHTQEAHSKSAGKRERIERRERERESECEYVFNLKVLS